jgi:hypothetical protein
MIHGEVPPAGLITLPTVLGVVGGMTIVTDGAARCSRQAGAVLDARRMSDLRYL